MYGLEVSIMDQEFSLNMNYMNEDIVSLIQEELLFIFEVDGEGD